MALIFGARHMVQDVDKELEQIQTLAGKMGHEIQVLDARMVFGLEHMQIALEKTDRAFEQGRNIAKSRGTEFILYSGAERQISKGLTKMGLKEGIEDLVIVSFGDTLPEVILENLGWVRNDEVLEPDLQYTDEYGIVLTEGSTVKDLRNRVLEKMALSELDR